MSTHLTYFEKTFAPLNSQYSIQKIPITQRKLQGGDRVELIEGNKSYLVWEETTCHVFGGGGHHWESPTMETQNYHIDTVGGINLLTVVEKFSSLHGDICVLLGSQNNCYDITLHDLKSNTSSNITPELAPGTQNLDFKDLQYACITDKHAFVVTIDTIVSVDLSNHKNRTIYHAPIKGGRFSFAKTHGDKHLVAVFRGDVYSSLIVSYDMETCQANGNHECQWNNTKIAVRNGLVTLIQGDCWDESIRSEYKGKILLEHFSLPGFKKTFESFVPKTINNIEYYGQNLFFMNSHDSTYVYEADMNVICTVVGADPSTKWSSYPCMMLFNTAIYMTVLNELYILK